MKHSYLERLNKGPEKNSDCVTLPQELDQSRGTKQPKESDIDEVFLKSKSCF